MEMYEVRDALRNYNRVKKMLTDCPSEIRHGGLMYYYAFHGIFGDFAFLPVHDDEMPPPVIRICKDSKNLSDVWHFELHLKNGMLVKLVENHGFKYWAAVDIEWAARYVMTKKTGIRTLERKEIFNAYAQILLRRILDVRPKFCYAKKDWKFQSYISEDEANLKMTRIIANYIRIISTTNKSKQNGKNKVRCSREHKKPVSVHLQPNGTP